MRNLVFIAVLIVSVAGRVADALAAPQIQIHEPHRNAIGYPDLNLDVVTSQPNGDVEITASYPNAAGETMILKGTNRLQGMIAVSAHITLKITATDGLGSVSEQDVVVYGTTNQFLIREFDGPGTLFDIRSDRALYLLDTTQPGDASSTSEFYVTNRAGFIEQRNSGALAGSFVPAQPVSAYLASWGFVASGFNGHDYVLDEFPRGGDSRYLGGGVVRQRKGDLLLLLPFFGNSTVRDFERRALTNVLTNRLDTLKGFDLAENGRVAYANNDGLFLHERLLDSAGNPRFPSTDGTNVVYFKDTPLGAGIFIDDSVNGERRLLSRTATSYKISRGYIFLIEPFGEGRTQLTKAPLGGGATVVGEGGAGAQIIDVNSQGDILWGGPVATAGFNPVLINSDSIGIVELPLTFKWDENG